MMRNYSYSYETLEMVIFYATTGGCISNSCKIKRSYKPVRWAYCKLVHNSKLLSLICLHQHTCRKHARKV